MNFETCYRHLKTVIAQDAGLLAWLYNNFKRNGFNLIEGAIDSVETLKPQEIPALVLEVGDGESERVVGGRAQETTGEILVAVVWEETDRARAFDQRLALPDLLVRAVMNNATLEVDGAEGAGWAWVDGWETDRGAKFPRHAVGVSVKAEFELDMTE